MTIRPLGDHILVKPLLEEKVTGSGIVLPDTVEKEKKMEGQVVAVGPGKFNEHGVRIAMEVQLGDKILFKKWGGDEVKMEEVEYKMITQEDVLAVIE